jgi:prepilin-type N-terminal cleavage/methylation domain-containing protein
MKKNGFTFVELLAMLAVLGILMLIAIPNISGMLKNQRLNIIKSDATNMIETAKVKARKERLIEKPKNRECYAFALNYLNDHDNIVKGPNGGLYDQFDSIVIYTREGARYKYYVRLVEKYKNKVIGINFLEEGSIKGLKTKDIKEVTNSTGLVKTDNRTSGINKLSSFGPVSSICDTVKGYYSGGNYCVEFNGKYYDDEGNQVSHSKYVESCS